MFAQFGVRSVRADAGLRPGDSESGAPDAGLA